MLQLEHEPPRDLMDALVLGNGGGRGARSHSHPHSHSHSPHSPHSLVAGNNVNANSMMGPANHVIYTGRLPYKSNVAPV